MKTQFVLAMTLLASSAQGWANIENFEDRVVNYVQICSPEGAGNFVIPEDEITNQTFSCLNASSGLLASTLDSGDTFIYGQSQLLQRISALESQIRVLQTRLGIYRSETGE